MVRYSKFRVPIQPEFCLDCKLVFALDVGGLKSEMQRWSINSGMPPASLVSRCALPSRSREISLWGGAKPFMAICIGNRPLEPKD
jgi:hypothetical protein